jgi:hypothetical protein
VYIMVLNLHAPTQYRIDDVKDSFYEELERVFDKFPKSHTEILLGDFSAKVVREDISKPTIGNESLLDAVVSEKRIAVWEQVAETRVAVAGRGLLSPGS